MLYHFFIYFALMWLGVTTLLSALSGWFSLMRRFPDRPNETPLLVLKRQSGRMGMGVSLSRILTLSACPSGLRVGMMRLFGPFCQEFFVPWNEITVLRKKYFWWRYAELSFGYKEGKLGISANVADNLWRIVPKSWPEAGSPPEPETRRQAFKEVFVQWLTMTVMASAFFMIAPRLMAPKGAGPPDAAAILFPAIVFGVGCTISYWRRRTETEPNGKG